MRSERATGNAEKVIHEGANHFFQQFAIVLAD
jgi:hypothetical protein